MSALTANVRFELLRLLRSQRVFLLILAPVAGPIGSAIAFVYFHVGLVGTARLLGLFVTGGLGAMVAIDYCALTVGEELYRRAHLTFFTLPQSRATILTGRLLVALGAPLGAFLLGGAEVWVLAGVLVTNQPGFPPTLLDPLHLYEALAVLMVFLGAITLTASIITRSASEAIVAGVLGGVVTVAAAFYFVFEHQISMEFPAALGLLAAVAVGWSLWRYEQLES